MFGRSNNIFVQKTSAFKLNLEGSLTLEEHDLWSNTFEGRENGMIITSCRDKREKSGGNTCLIRLITDQNKLRKANQELVVVNEKTKLGDEYGD